MHLLRRATKSTNGQSLQCGWQLGNAPLKSRKPIEKYLLAEVEMANTISLKSARQTAAINSGYGKKGLNLGKSLWWDSINTFSLKKNKQPLKGGWTLSILPMFCPCFYHRNSYLAESIFVGITGLPFIWICFQVSYVGERKGFCCTCTSLKLLQEISLLAYV